MHFFLMKPKPVHIAPFEKLYPFKSNFMDRNGLKYHYLDEGAGEPIVMVHGNPTWSFYYREMVRALSPSYRVVVPDHMGCGLSDKPGLNRYDFSLKSRIDDFTALMNHLEFKDGVTLMVHDWGGMIGLAWALDHIDRIRRIIITNTAGFFPPGNKTIPKRLRVIRNMAFLAKPAVLLFNLFSRGALYMAPKKPLSSLVKKGLTAPYNSFNNRIATYKFVQGIPLEKGDPGYDIVKTVDEKLNKLSAFPMLIMWGKYDFVFDIDYFNEWIKRFPDARHHLFHDAGHYLFEDLPGKTIDTVKAFLEKNPV